MAMSRLMLPVGRVPTTVPDRGVKAPFVAIENPEIVDDPEFDVYTKRLSGVTACQQVAAPCVGTLALTAESAPLAETAYDEIAAALCPPTGPVSETKAVPLGANRTAKAPGPTLGLITIGPSVPSIWI